MAILTVADVDAMTAHNPISALFPDQAAYEAYLGQMIPQIEADYLAIRNRPFDVNESGETVYPANAKGIALKMLYYRLNTDPRIGIKSEKADVLSFSTNYDTELDSGYPVGITGQITRYIGGK